MSGGVEWVLCAHTYEERVLCVCSGCCVHTQGTHRRRECSVWRCGVGVVCTHIGGKSVVCGVCSGPTHTPTHVSTHNMCAHNTLHHECAHNTLHIAHIHVTHRHIAHIAQRHIAHNTLPCHVLTTLLFFSNHSSYITFFPPALVSLATPFSMPHAINAHQIAITKRARNNRCALKKVTTR